MARAMAILGSGVHKRSKPRACNRCGGNNYEQGYATCVACRAVTAALHQAWRELHRATGLCTECCEKRKRGEYAGAAHALGNIYMKCDTHLEYARTWKAENYARRRELGLCAYGACPVKCETVLCGYHSALHRMDAAGRERLRAQFRTQGSKGFAKRPKRAA